MKNLLPFRLWPFGPKRPEFYLCKCKQCGFMQTYEISSFEEISLDGTDKNADSAFVQAKKLPRTCPKCNGKFKHTRIPSPLRY